MGTSVEMIDRTYGHLASGAEEAATAKLDAAYARRLRQEHVTAESGENGQTSQCRMNTRAGDGARTHDPQLGKLMLYQLSYAREACILAVSLIHASPRRPYSGIFPIRARASGRLAARLHRCPRCRTGPALSCAAIPRTGTKRQPANLGAALRVDDQG